MSKEFEKQFKELQERAKILGMSPHDLLKRMEAELSSAAEPKSTISANETTVNTEKSSDTSNQSNDVQGEALRMENTWNHVQTARHPDRPTALEYIDLMSDQYMELHGDRCFGDDKALVGGLCTIEGIHFTFLAHQKGRNMKENIYRNYGMSHPEGYRKALRLAKQAAHFNRPIITLIDTSGAYPGLASEERGIGEAIASNLLEFSVLGTPIICIIIGEGGSGGALGIGVGDRVFMLENSVYSVISPEGFASILLRDASRVKESAVLMKMTAQDIYRYGFIDGIIAEPEGGAHLHLQETGENIKGTILQSYQELCDYDASILVARRSQRIMELTRERETSTSQKHLFTRIKNFFAK